jgi:hypothetical protein
MLADRYQDYMFSLIKKVIDEIGPRPPCSEAEKKLGRLLAEEWKPICDRVDVEPFTCSPTAPLGSLYIMVLCYFVAVILYWYFPPLALAMASVACSILLLEILWLREFIDFLFPRKQGENVIGTMRPKGQPTQRVVVSGHMDSAYEWNLLLYLKSASILVVVVGILAALAAFGGCLVKTIAYFNGFSDATALTGVGIALIALTPVMGLFLVFTSWRPVPGAFDNLSAVSVVAGLGQYIGEAKRSEVWFPETTEVVLLATSSEEAGHRGAKRYVTKHLAELKTIPTYGLFLEMIKDEKNLAVWKGESSTGARHDPELVKMAQEVATSHSWPIFVGQMPVLLTTDADSFSLNGVSAICLTSCDHSKLDPTYHTRYDTHEHVRPESLSVVLQLVIDMIQRIDRSEKT